MDKTRLIFGVGMEDNYDVNGEKCSRDEWNSKVSRCPKAVEGFEPYHKWIPVAYIKTQSMEQVSMMMCGICFHEVNISEAFKNRDCFKS